MTLRASIVAFLETDALPFELADDTSPSGGDGADGGLARVGGTSPDGAWSAFLQWSESDAQLAVYCVSALAVPEDRRAAVMELCTRANFGLRVGALELDLDDGELRVRTSADFEGAPAAAAHVRNLFWLAVATMQRYLPAVARVVEGDAPVDALGAVER